MRNALKALCLVSSALLMTGAAISSVEAQRSGASSSTRTAPPSASVAACSAYNPCAMVSPALDAIPTYATVREMPVSSDNSGAATGSGRGASRAQGQAGANAAPGAARSATSGPCPRGGGNFAGRGSAGGGDFAGRGGFGGGNNGGGGFGRGAGAGGGRSAGAGGAFPCPPTGQAGGGNGQAGGGRRGGAQAGAGKPD